jgi:hypothetical protein
MAVWQPRFDRQADTAPDGDVGTFLTLYVRCGLRACLSMHAMQGCRGEGKDTYLHLRMMDPCRGACRASTADALGRKLDMWDGTMYV